MIAFLNTDSTRQQHHHPHHPAVRFFFSLFPPDLCCLLVQPSLTVHKLYLLSPSTLKESQFCWPSVMSWRKYLGFHVFLLCLLPQTAGWQLKQHIFWQRCQTCTLLSSKFLLRSRSGPVTSSFSIDSLSPWRGLRVEAGMAFVSDLSVFSKVGMEYHRWKELISFGTLM